ncbi:MAG: thiamine-phosphate kinase [Acidobacteria bacterium]|nr:thiamine-phosphate kinase [Acidobacteriota bacterium]
MRSLTLSGAEVVAPSRSPIAPTELPTVADLGERALIQRITARLATPAWLVVGPGDDAAVVEPERGALDVFTTDVQVEGVHFDRRFVAPDAIGHRALAVNLSDLAAMGARPRAALLSLVLPDALDVDAIDGLVDGLLAVADAHGVAVVGGNISRSPGPLVVDVTAIGSVRRRRILTRSGARAGDGVYVTGTIGDALVGLQSLQRRADRKVRPDRNGVGADQVGPQERRYLRPEPRVRAGLALAGHRAATACMDLSDGLADAVRQIAAASRVGITIDAAALPIAGEVRRWHDGQGRDPVAASLEGGDDYELLFTSRPAHQGRLRGVQRALGSLPITRIGAVTREPRLVLKTADGLRELPGGFEHFR